MAKKQKALRTVALNKTARNNPPTPEQLRGLACIPIQPVTADEIRDFRRSLGWTQEQFARAYGLSVETIRSWEQAKKAPGNVATAFLSLLKAVVSRGVPAPAARS